MSQNQLIKALLTGIPYFGPALCALQGPPIRHKYFLPLVKAVADTNVEQICILEIGSWAGASTVSWAIAIQNVGREGRITCVDLWQPYFDVNVETDAYYRAMNEAAENGMIFKIFLHNIAAAKVSNMVDYFVGSARDILPKLPSSMVDIVYIDGSHVYESVRADIHEAQRLVRDGGIVCGDDLELQKHEVVLAEHKAAVELGKDYVYSPAIQASYHPGVTEAVAGAFAEVSAWEGMWAVRKSGSEWSKVELDLSNLQIPDHIASAGASEEETRPVREIIGQTREFNLVKISGRFLAAAKSLGPTDLLVERLGERDLPPLFFVGGTPQEAREKAESAEKLVPHVELIEEFREYNLVKAADMFIAVAKKLGPVNLFHERLGERDLPPVILVASAISDLRQQISALTDSVSDRDSES